MIVFDRYSFCTELLDVFEKTSHALGVNRATLTVSGIVCIIVRENITHRRSYAC